MKEDISKKSKIINLLKSNSKLLLGIGIGVIIMTAGIAMAKGDFIAKRQTNNTQKQDQSNQKPPDSQKTEVKTPDQTTSNSSPQQNTQSNTTQTTKTSIPTASPVTTPPAPTCNESLKQAYTNSYNSLVNYENSIHIAWHGDGPMDSSYYARQQGAEDARHEARLDQLLADYQQKLVSISCN